MLTISGNDGHSSLTLERKHADSWHARLVSDHLAAECPVYAFRGEELAEFFAGLAADWRGWQGPRSFSSIEGQLTIAASMDRLGHVSLAVELTPDLTARWTARVVLGRDAGSLAKLAQQAAAFVAPGLA